jgi:protein TonB
MDFSTGQDHTSRRWMGLSVVVLFHLLLGWALVTGLARKVVEEVGVLVETRLIEEVKPPEAQPKPPPAPPPNPEPTKAKRVEAPRAVAATPKKTETAPPLPSPARPAATPTAQVAPADTAPAVAGAAPRESPPAAVEPPRPVGPVPAGIACSRTPPPLAPSVSTEVRGSVFVIGTVKAGRVVQVEVERNTLKGVSDRRVLRAFVQSIETAMKEGYVCAGDDLQIRQEFYFDIR